MSREAAMTARTALGMVLALAAAPCGGRTRFEATGHPQSGAQDRERPTVFTPGAAGCRIPANPADEDSADP